jgi:hypothetical protein
MEIKAYEPPRGSRPLIVRFDDFGRIAGFTFARSHNQWSYRDIGSIQKHIATANEVPVPTEYLPKSDTVRHVSNRGGRY